LLCNKVFIVEVWDNEVIKHIPLKKLWEENGNWFGELASEDGSDDHRFYTFVAAKMMKHGYTATREYKECGLSA